MRPLTAVEEPLLCGRESALAEVMANCLAERHTVVSSEPGLGISSLFEAGLVPALKRDKYIVVVHRYWQGASFAGDFTEAIAEAVREQADPQFLARGEPLDEMLRYITSHTRRRVVLFLDQFEDYIRCQANSHHSDLFDAELGRVIAHREGCIVFGVHTHAMPAFERLNQHVPNLLGFHLRLEPLTLEAAKEAVTREAVSRATEEVEPAAMDALLASPVITRSPGLVHPFFLKVATERLLETEYRAKSHVLRMSTIEAFDGADRLVLESLDPVIREFSVTHQDLLFRWFSILVSPENERLSVTEKGLTEYAGRLNRFVLILLPALVEKGILRTLQIKDTLRYEVAHDGYAIILRDWWERREAKIIARRRAIFRITSVSVALGSIVLIYLIWLILGMK